MEGKFDFEYGSSKKHSNLAKAKRYCSTKANCFGIRESSLTISSVTFPIEMRLEGSRYIHKKENISGNFHLSYLFKFHNSLMY